jgi:YfiH family protein
VQDLDRHRPVHGRLVGFVDGPHSASSDFLDDLELTIQDFAADEGVCGSHPSRLIPKLFPGYEGRVTSAITITNRLESRLLRQAGFAHAFFTRSGGVSTGPYASLNFSSSVGDTRDNVAKNVAIAAEILGTKSTNMYFLSQVHGRDVVLVTGAEHPARVLELRGDAVLTASAGVACGVRSADCVPVLFGEIRSGVVAAAHAGWRGLVAGVLRATIRKLREHAGPGAQLIAAIGPHISVDAFEVGADVAGELAALAPLTSVVRQGANGRPHVDLRSVARAELRAEGLEDTEIDDVFGCTVGDPQLFFSYRRDGPRSGRHLSAIVAR